MIRLDRAGFEAGRFFVPAATGDVLLRLATAGGDDTTDAVVGHITAHAYLRAANSALCPDCPVFVCGVPPALDAQNFSGFTNKDDFSDFIFNDTRDWQVFSYVLFSPPGLQIDTTTTYGGNPTLSIKPFYITYVEGQFGDSFSGAPDVTFMSRYNLESWSAVNGLNFVMHLFYHGIPGTYQDVLLYIEDGDRLKVRYLSARSPTVLTTVDIGPASDVMGKDIEMLARVQTLSASTLRYSLYVHEPCSPPEMYYELELPNLSGSAATNWIGMERWFGSGDGPFVPAEPTLRIYQEAIDTDPTVFGLVP